MEAPAQPLVAFANGWDAHRDRHCIWIVSPNGYDHHHAFDEVAEALSEAFMQLGGTAPITRSADGWEGRAPIVLGPQLLHLLGDPPLPEDSILYNLEQVASESIWLNRDYLGRLRRYPVLDYSRRNMDKLRAAGVPHAGLLELGYSPTLTRIPHSEKDVDVLFYGTLTSHRKETIAALRAQGLAVLTLFGVYGTARDEAIARAKVVLNLHQYASNIFERVRILYLLANRACVVSEGDPEDPDIQSLAGGLTIVPRDKIVDACVELVGNDAKREAISATGFQRIRALKQSDLLRRCVLEQSGATRRNQGRGPTVVAGATFGAEILSVDDTRFVQCRFTDTTLFYFGGGVPKFDDCSLARVKFEFGGPSARTVAYLKFLLEEQIIEGF
jgi:hypothetical protein